MASIITFIAIEAILVAIATRIILLARRTREAPEMLIGSFFLALAAMVIVRSLGSVPALAEGAWAVLTLQLGHVLFCTAIVILFFFTQRVFRPQEGWARAFAWGGSIVMVIAYALRFAYGEVLWAKLLVSALRLFPFAWAFLESYAYWNRMRKRAAIGLADPVVTNRFLLWSVWTGAAAGVPLFALVFRLFAWSTGTPEDLSAVSNPNEAGLVIAVFSSVLLASGIVAVVSLWLSFFPPKPYTNWVRGSLGMEG